jgi:hypothetical protein
MKHKYLLLFIAILYSGLSDILDFYFKFNILGLSFFTTIVPWFFLFIIILSNFYQFNHNFYIYLFIIFSAHISVAIVRYLFYEESAYNLIFGPRYIYFYLILIWVLNISNFNIKSLNQYKLLFNLIIIFHFINSLLKIIGYPHMDLSDINSDYYVEDSRFGGFYGAPNVQSNVTSIIYLIFVFINLEMKTSKIIIFTLMTLISILPTISRSGFILTFLTFIFYFVYHILIKKTTIIFKFKKILHIVIIYFFTIYLFILLELDTYTISILQRFTTNDNIAIDQSRSNRFFYFYDILRHNLNYLFAGIPDILQSSVYDPLFSISDNTFTLLISKFGIFFSILFLFILKISFYKIKFNPVIIFYFSLAIIVFTTNNSIIWSQWSFYFILGLFFINNKNNFSLN